MRTPRIGYLIGLLTTLIMAGAAITAEGWNAARAEDIQAYAVFAGLGALVGMIAQRWYGEGALWVFLVPAVICFLAGLRGLVPFWGFLVGYLLAGSIGFWAAWWPWSGRHLGSRIIRGHPDHRPPALRTRDETPQDRHG